MGRRVALEDKLHGGAHSQVVRHVLEPQDSAH